MRPDERFGVALVGCLVLAVSGGFLYFVFTSMTW
jgi:hypothetical protein